jgi:hypothetical protein
MAQEKKPEKNDKMAKCPGPPGQPLGYKALAGASLILNGESCPGEFSPEIRFPLPPDHPPPTPGLDKVLTENPPQSIHISPSGNVFEDSGTSLPLFSPGETKNTHGKTKTKNLPPPQRDSSKYFRKIRVRG